MTIEEKAKAYNKVREKIALRFGSNVAEEIFSEFEMSEDEKVRKALVDALNKNLGNGIEKYGTTLNAALAWLEKQEEPELPEDLGEYVAELSKQFPEVSFAKLSRIAVRVKNWLEEQGKKKSIDELTQQEAMDIAVAKCFEQGEQEETLCDKCKKEQPSHSCQDITALGRCALEMQSKKKPVDKVVPKFQNGQWIVWQNKCYKVNYNGCGYELIDQNGLSTSLEYGTVDASARLWDITKDAKKGDVLQHNGCTFIFICIEKGVVRGFEVYLCNGTKACNFGKPNKDNDYSPATKEQCDTLFAKMKAEGYEWPEETHELKEIKQKSAWSEEDMKEALRTEYEKGRADTIAEIGGNFIEDDSEEFDIAIETLKEAGQFSSAKWLESIKDRIQPKHEWRDEDENGLGDALWAIKQARTIAKDENDMGNLWYAENWLNTNFD